MSDWIVKNGQMVKRGAAKRAVKRHINHGVERVTDAINTLTMLLLGAAVMAGAQAYAMPESVQPVAIINGVPMPPPPPPPPLVRSEVTIEQLIAEVEGMK